MKSVQVGDKVTTVFDGEVVAVDNELGKVTLLGNTRGAQHIDWEMEVHWATEFYEGRPPVGRCEPTVQLTLHGVEADFVARALVEAKANAKSPCPPGFVCNEHGRVGR